MSTPILDILKKYPNSLEEIEKTIKELDCDKLFIELTHYVNSLTNKKFDKIIELIELFQHYQSADYIPYSVVPKSMNCQYGKKCYRTNPGHTYQCHGEHKKKFWTEPFLEFLRKEHSKLSRYSRNRNNSSTTSRSRSRSGKESQGTAGYKSTRRRRSRKRYRKRYKKHSSISK